MFDLSKQEEKDEISDLRMRADKAKEYLDRHRQVLDRLRTLQMSGSTPVASVSPSTNSQQGITSTARCSLVTLHQCSL